MRGAAATRVASLRLTPQDEAKLNRLAAEVGCTRAEAIRGALSLAIDDGAARLRARMADLPGEAARSSRNARMAARRDAGASWRVIAEEFGLSLSGARAGVLAHRGEVERVPALRVLGRAG